MRRGLGKGLSQVLADSKAAARPTPAKAVKPEPAKSDATLSIKVLRPNQRQPRTEFDSESLQELAASISEIGILQPLLVRPISAGQYEIIAGERRFRAAKLAGLTEVPVVIRSASSEASLQMALIENIQREDISALESARAYQQLAQEFGMTQDQIAQKVGKSRAAITNTMRLLRLPAEIQGAILDGSVTEGQVRPLLTLPDEATQCRLFRRIVEHDLSARQAESLVKSVLGLEDRPEPKAKPAVDPNWQALESRLSTYFGTRTLLTRGKKGGRLVIDFHSDDELQRILDTLGVGD